TSRIVMKKAVATTARTLQRWGSEAMGRTSGGFRRRSRSNERLAQGYSVRRTKRVEMDRLRTPGSDPGCNESVTFCPQAGTIAPAAEPRPEAKTRAAGLAGGALTRAAMRSTATRAATAFARGRC